jgi:hypothetical protein
LYLIWYIAWLHGRSGPQGHLPQNTS